MNLLVDTGPFSAANDTRRPPNQVSELLVGNRVFLAEATVAELRYGAISAGWGPARRLRLESASAKPLNVRGVTSCRPNDVGVLRSA